jgi:hypothetical protein
MLLTPANRVDGWRYTEWYHWNQTSLTAEWGSVDGLYAAELYDHRAADAAAKVDPAVSGSDYDSDTSEVVNVVHEKENRDGIVLKLARLIREQFDKRRPSGMP